MKFTTYTGLDLPKVAEDVLRFWKQQHIFKKSITTRQGNPTYVFYDGPPSANGMPGIHHVMARTLKDLFPRYKTMKGYQVTRKAGWDTHGLPVEMKVEKELGITKEDIGKTISIEDYNAACKKAVMRYTDVWNTLTEKIGYWVDTDTPYITYQPKYMESVWWLLKQLYTKGLLYKGYTIQPYSPKAGTGLSSHELNQPGTYQNVTDTSVTAQFKVLDGEIARKVLYNPYKKVSGNIKLNSLSTANIELGKNVYLLAWTTTPWTLPSNTALTVGPNIRYLLVNTRNRYTGEEVNVVIAKDLFKKYFYTEEVHVNVRCMSGLGSGFGESKVALNEGKVLSWIVLNEFTGKDLVGIRYEQLLPYARPYQTPENAFRVIAGNFVTTEDGTGIVHTAPTFGADDALVAKQATPPVPPMLVLDEHHNPVPLVDLQGRFRPELQELAGKYVKNEYYAAGEAPEKSVDVELAIKLKQENKAFKVEKYTHSYPNCWRTDKPILYYPLDSWFIKATAVKDRMHALNQTIRWKPKATGEGRFGNWLANANDWNLSRSRYWGIPLPIWRTDDGTEEIIIGSVAELKAEMNKAVAAGVMDQAIFEDFVVGDMSEVNYDRIDLHKNIVDPITLISPSGKPMKREPDLIDVWFDSGAMPYAQWHYPFENKELIDNGTAFPADFIAEGVDQTRGWFYTLHAIATMVFDSVAYKNVISNGLVLDKDGKKMSKRLGNVVDPFKVLPEHGPDAVRWYMISNANPWENLKFDMEGVVEVKRKFFGTLYNTYAFMALYANIDGFTYAEADLALQQRPEIDQWILSELHTLIQKVDEAYTDYEATRAARLISSFVQENLSNWYVRLSRRRFWKGTYQQDKISAYQTLYTCLSTVAKLSAPMAPFFMERLYRDLEAVTQKEGCESVHLATFPMFEASMVNTGLERKMEIAQKVTSLALSIRQKEKIKVRQPLQTLMIPVLDQEQREAIEAVAELIQSEVNVKEVRLLDDASDILVKQIKPNFKVLGPRFGQEMKAIAAAVKTLGQHDIQTLERKGELRLKLEYKSLTLQLSDVEISSQDVEGWLVANAGGLTVALDVTVDDTLRKEGITRELVNRIQNLRKASGFAVTDTISIQLQKDGYVEDAVASNAAYLKTETLATVLSFEEKLDKGTPVAFDGVDTKLFIQKQ